MLQFAGGKVKSNPMDCLRPIFHSRFGWLRGCFDHRL